MQAYNGGFWGAMQKKSDDCDSSSDHSSSYSSEDSSDPESGDLPNSCEKGIFKCFRIFSMSKTRCLLLTLFTVLFLCAIGTAVLFVVKPKCLGFSKKQKDDSSKNASGLSNESGISNADKDHGDSSGADMVLDEDKQAHILSLQEKYAPAISKTKAQVVHVKSESDWKKSMISTNLRLKVLVIEGTQLFNTILHFDGTEQDQQAKVGEALLEMWLGNSISGRRRKIVVHTLPSKTKEQEFKDMKLPFEVTLIGSQHTDLGSTLKNASVDQISTRIVIPATKQQGV